MPAKKQAELEALFAAREYGIGTIFFRNTLAKRLGLTLTESLCLTELGTHGPSTPTELARLTGLTSGAMTTLLDRLEKKHLARRRPNPNDRRGVIVEIDEAPTKDTQGLVSGIQKANQQVAARFSEDELAIVTEFLTRLADSLVEESRKIDERR
jgi:DNA-binding MarR family transcriptional regulator